MHRVVDSDTQEIRIDFLQDTLFGVNAFNFHCTAQLSLSPTGPSSTLQLLIAPPWPEQFEAAHSLTFRWNETLYSGTVRAAHRQPDGRLLLTLERQP
ncbi:MULTISPECIES: hypothetical protein [Pseudomonas]|uniref:Uncharacterized protein n=1 Tax=Pseudomonas asplenii TaxID=53407 RepID=A0A0N0E4M6_9PSED|nr:hypothetical protein [Pseudomonas fuscovaginae]KPA91426.1 hypothetical protein PF66_02309 [Pseudomonas fuscovaginae]KPA99164.1 hypothetical protein PF70_00645 [Pseudomonas fuscovaginae]